MLRIFNPADYFVHFYHRAEGCELHTDAVSLLDFASEYNAVGAPGSVVVLNGRAFLVHVTDLGFVAANGEAPTKASTIAVAQHVHAMPQAGASRSDVEPPIDRIENDPVWEEPTPVQPAVARRKTGEHERMLREGAVEPRGDVTVRYPQALTGRRLAGVVVVIASNGVDRNYRDWYRTSVVPRLDAGATVIEWTPPELRVTST